ncbi:peptidoglycan-binding domain-containing protein [Agromyces salentinus]|uniref:Peptidoglycan binding-like domain-containing protein n=1 Tax=Agromyces salentinus TaxID=269421 RepID=A0ABN2MG42_9MICO|nr:peptidoglycan-binding domain-containing protein [Agromyces salentinus]
MRLKNRVRTVIAAATVALALGGTLSVAAAPAPAEAAGRCVDYQYSYGGYAGCVGNIQVLLNAFQPRLGSYGKLAVDNSYGPATRSAVIAFQRYFGLAADGIVGRQTWGVLCGPQMGPGPISWYPYATARAAGCNI